MNAQTPPRPAFSFTAVTGVVTAALLLSGCRSEPPVFTTPPADVTVECDGAGNLADLSAFLGQAAATDTCRAAAPGATPGHAS